MNIEVEDSIAETIQLRTKNDAVTLEYDDTVLLIFSPDESDLTEFYEIEGEYIRDSATVHIIDNDREFNWLK